MLLDKKTLTRSSYTSGSPSSCASLHTANSVSPNAVHLPYSWPER